MFMPMKTIRNHKYKWAASRSSMERAERLKEKFKSSGKVIAAIHVRKLGLPTALVPTVYDVYVRPNEEGKKLGYTLDSRILETLIRITISVV